MEATEVIDVQSNEIIRVEESEKDWKLVGKFTEYEFGQLVEFYCHAENFLPAINFAKERARGLVADPTTKDGQIARKAVAKRIGQIEKQIADVGMEVAKVLKAKPKEVDACRKRVKDTLIAYKDEVLAPLKEIEQRQEEIVEIGNLPAQGVGCDSNGLKMLLDRLDEMAKTPEYWKESLNDANDAVIEARRQLNDMLARQEKAEADQRELEELRKKQAEMALMEKQKAEAELKKAQEEAAKAKAEAERMEREKAEAERKQMEAEEAARAAETAKAEAEAKVPEWKKNEIPESERLWPEDERERKRRINREAMQKMVELTLGDETMAKAIITAIAKDEVPHIHIEY